MRSKLQQKRDGPFHVLEWINNNEYKLDLPSKYNISATFNVSNLFFFYVGDNSRSNFLRREGMMSINKNHHEIHCMF
jgi:hypothetical protein